MLRVREWSHVRCVNTDEAQCSSAIISRCKAPWPKSEWLMVSDGQPTTEPCWGVAVLTVGQLLCNWTSATWSNTSRAAVMTGMAQPYEQHLPDTHAEQVFLSSSAFSGCSWFFRTPPDRNLPSYKLSFTVTVTLTITSQMGLCHVCWRWAFAVRLNI